jgi:hypothetical protein
MKQAAMKNEKKIRLYEIGYFAKREGNLMWGNITQCEILGFRREVAENYALLRYYAASGG